MKRISFLLIALLAVSPSFAQDGPFGISMGDPVSKHGCVEVEKDGWYLCNEISKPDSALESYHVFGKEEYGILLIRADGKVYKNDKTGIRVKRAVDITAGEMKRKYGDWNNHLDYIQPSSILTKSSEWALSLYKGERYYEYTWGFELFERQDNIIGISVNATPSDTNDTQLMVAFVFENYNEYIQIEDQEIQAEIEQLEVEARRIEVIRQQAEEARQQKEKETKKEATEELLYLYLENPIAGELKYKGNNIVLGGFVTNMEIIDDLIRSTLSSFYDIDAIAIIQITFHENPLMEALGNAIVSGLGGSELGGVNCWLDRKNSQDAITLNRSHYVEIKGTVQGQIDLVSPYDVNVYPCSIIAQSANK